MRQGASPTLNGPVATLLLMSSRPAVPADLELDLLIEAGHRCAIPTCRATASLQIEHIDD